MPKPAKANIKEFIILDENGNEIIRHGINGIILLAHPNAEEREKLPKDERGGYPVISYQGGETPIVFSLLTLMRNVVNDLLQKWAMEMERIRGEIIVPKNGEIKK